MVGVDRVLLIDRSRHRPPGRQPGSSYFLAPCLATSFVKRTYHIGKVIADAPFRVKERLSKCDGRWKMEADKVVFGDPATGMDCIIQRSKKRE